VARRNLERDRQIVTVKQKQLKGTIETPTAQPRERGIVLL